MWYLCQQAVLTVHTTDFYGFSFTWELALPVAIAMGGGLHNHPALQHSTAGRELVGRKEGYVSFGRKHTQGALGALGDCYLAPSRLAMASTAPCGS